MHTIQRAGTYACSIQTPEAPEAYSLIRVTFAQNQQIIVEKQTGDEGFTVNADTVEVELTQQETLAFMPSTPSPMGAQKGGMAFLQCRCYKDALSAPASRVWPLTIFDSLNREVLPNG